MINGWFTGAKQDWRWRSREYCEDIVLDLEEFLAGLLLRLQKEEGSVSDGNSESDSEGK